MQLNMMSLGIGVAIGFFIVPPLLGKQLVDAPKKS